MISNLDLSFGRYDPMGDIPNDGEEGVASACEPTGEGALQRHFGVLQATALNVTMIVGAGVFITIPLMLRPLPGPYALLGWLVAGLLMLVDGLIWSELGAALPGSGGSYLYLLESFGRERWGRLMAFLFIWQFLISGPLEVASGFIAMGQFAGSLSPEFNRFSDDHTLRLSLGHWQDKELAVIFSPMRWACFGVGCLILFLLYRRITNLGKITITFWLGVLGVIVWILIEGALRFDAAKAFDTEGIRFPGLWGDSFSALDAGDETPFQNPAAFWTGLGAAMILAMYSYLGYYNVCYIGDEVRDPARTIPRSILLSALLVILLFVSLHLAMLGTVSWREAKESDSLPALFMRQAHPDAGWPVVLVTLLLIWSCAGSAFSALLGYSRIPYGAARYGHFFSVLGKVHPTLHIPHVSLLVVGGLTLFWSFFDLEVVINALVTTRILEQFVGQIVAVMLLRRFQPDRPRPFQMWFYPLPCFLALAGWLFLYVSAGVPYIVVGLATLIIGVWMFLFWSQRTEGWPFASEE